MTVTTVNGNPSSADAFPLRAVPVDFRPNPMGTEGRISFSLVAPARGSLSIYGADGRLVRTLMHGRIPAGAQSILWDGRDAGGRKVPSGVYLYRLDGEGVREGGRVVLVD